MLRLLDLLFPKKVFHGDGGPYLTRYKLFSLGKKLIRIYFHVFHRSDEDRELHSHPWRWSVGLILKGGYREKRLVARLSVCEFLRNPGSFVFLRKTDFHRVTLLEKESWSLFIAGPEEGTWYFLDPRTDQKWQWEEFIKRKGLEPIKD